MQIVVNIIQGGVGSKNVTLEMPRISEGNRLILFFTTENSVNLSSKNLTITSSEISATLEKDRSFRNDLLFFITGFFTSLTLANIISYLQKRQKRAREEKSIKRLIDEFSK